MPPRGLAALLALAAACSAPPDAVSGPAWRSVFDGQLHAGIRPIQFGGEGRVHVENGRLVLEQGSPLTGVTFATALPDCDYELELVGARTLGNDFFCGLTFPFRGGCLSLILGGWAGAVCGLSSLDGRDASQNSTRTLRSFGRGRDYRILVRVTAETIAVAIDGEPLLAVDPRGHAIAVRAEMDLSQPFGLACYATRASYSSVRWRPLAAD